MKWFFAIAALFVALSSHAADRKVGNVIAVEREIPDLYNTCLKNLQGPTDKPQSFFSCAFKYITDGEIPVSKGRVLKLMNERCQVVGESTNGFIMITFAGAKSPSTFEASRACLERALSEKDFVKVIVYTLD